MDFYYHLRNWFTGQRDIIRLAITGVTASGKTYWLKDLLLALQHLGAKVKKHPNPDYATFQDLWQVTRDITTTILYPLRQRTIYAAVIELNGVEKELLVVDTPGECFTPPNLQLFNCIYNSLMNCRARIFHVQLWTREGEKNPIKMVYLNAQDSDRVSGSGSEELTHEQYAERQNTNYFDNRNEIRHLQALGYRQSGTAEHLNGEQFLQHFLEFNIDSALNAIMDAWTRLGVSDNLAKGLQGTTATQLTRGSFRWPVFVFLYYAITATDIVICDLVAKRNTIGVTIRLDDQAVEADDKFTIMVSTLAQLCEGDDKKRWYLVFKGIDSVMAQDKYRALWHAVHHNLNYVYSLSVMVLGETVMATGEDGHLSVDSLKAFDEDLSYQVQAPHERVKRGADTEDTSDLYDDFKDRELDKFIDMRDAVVLSGKKDNAGNVVSNTLRDHLIYRLQQFTHHLSHYERENMRHDVWGFQPHVYFAAHPIDSEFFIRGFKPNDSDAMKFEALFDPNQGIAFGTIQALCDILEAHGVPTGDDRGKILNYFLG